VADQERVTSLPGKSRGLELLLLPLAEPLGFVVFLAGVRVVPVGQLPQHGRSLRPAVGESSSAGAVLLCQLALLLASVLGAATRDSPEVVQPDGKVPLDLLALQLFEQVPNRLAGPLLVVIPWALARIWPIRASAIFRRPNASACSSTWVKRGHAPTQPVESRFHQGNRINR
jgi:hypothetical protein